MKWDAKLDSRQFKIAQGSTRTERVSEPKSKKWRKCVLAVIMVAVKGTTNWRDRHVRCGQREPSK